MSNKEIYSKTLGFSLRRLLFDVLAFAGIGLLGLIGFIITEKAADEGMIGLLVGTLIGIVLAVFVLRYVSYAFKAGQIAMITRLLTKGDAGENVIDEGVRIVKERFLTVAAFYAATRIIKGIFNEIGRVIIRVGRSVGGSKGDTVGSAISSIIQVIVSYLSDCCLGWVFFRSDESSAKATCEGAVIFFKHGKTLVKNLGRVFGMGLASFVVIGGLLTGIFYGIANLFPNLFATLAAEIAESGEDVSSFIATTHGIMLVAAIIAAVILWNILHAVFVRPLVLTGVLRNYLESGIHDTPDENSFGLLDDTSRKFAKLHGQLA